MPDARCLEKRQKVLADFGEFALRSDDLDAVLTQACRLVAEALGTGHAKVLEIEHERRTLFIRAGVGWDEGIVGRLRLPIAEHSSETYSIELGEPVITNNLASEDRFDFPAFLKEAGVKALANVPIFLPGGKPFGLLQVDASEPRAFDDDDSQFLRTYAAILGPVIDRLLKAQTLSTSEERYRTLFEAIDEGYLLGEVIFDEGGKAVDLLFLEANPAAVRLAGRDFTGRRMRELDPRYEEHWYEACGRVVLTGEPYRAEHYAEPHGRWFNYQLTRVGPPESRRIASIFQDVTDRRHAEQALRESEEKYRTLFDSVDEGFCVIEVLFDDAGHPADYVFLEINAAFERQTGLADAIGKRMRDLAPDHEQHWFEIYGQIARSGEPQRFEQPAEALGRWYDVYAFRIGDPEQRRVAILFNDVGERKQAERDLREREERKAFLLALSDALRPLADAEEIQATTTRLLAAHLGVDRAMYAEVTGEPGAETGIIRGQFVRAAVPGRPAPAPFPDHFTYETFGAMVMASRYSGEGLIVTDAHADPRLDATERAAWDRVGVRAAIVAPLVKGGRLIAELGLHSQAPRAWTDAEVSLVREVSERTWAAAERARAEAALRESEAKYRTLFDTIDSGYALTDNVRDRDGRVVDLFGVDFNRSYTHHSGLPPFAGRRASEVITVQPEWLRQFEEVTRTGVAARHENYIAERDRWVSTHYSLVGDLGGDRVAVVFDDITDRKRAEAALRESEERQAFLLRLSDALRAEPEADAMALFALRTLQEKLQLDRCYIAEYQLDEDKGDVLHQVGNDRVPPLPNSVRLSDYPDAFEIALDRTLVIDDVGQADFLSENDKRNMHALGMQALVTSAARKGENVPLFAVVAVSAAPRRWTPGEIALVEEVNERLWAALERARAEAALRESEERFRLLLQSVRDYAIFTTDPDGLITSWPAGAAAVYGWSEDETLGRSIDLTFLPEDVARGAPQEERETATREGLAPNVRWHVRKDGSRIFIEGSTQPLVGADGGIREFIKIGQDVTEVRRTQQALVEGEQRLRTLMEGIPQLVWRSCDEGRWTWSSPQWQAFTGQSLEESLALGWLDAVHLDDRDDTMRAWEAARPHGMLDVEYRVRRAADGEYLWHHTRSLPVQAEGGQVVEWLGTTTDVQQLKELQERQAVMVAELQHRTRNLIAVVRSIAQQTMAQTGPTEAFREEFKHRLEALARVQGLLSRSDEEPITIETLIRMELDALGAELEAGRIEIQGPPARIRHSVVQTLALALHELATNARKYGALASDRGSLQVRWWTYASAKDERLALEWTETGGQPPKSESESRRGYGRELLERALPYSLNAKTSFEHDEAGVRCTIDMPLKRLKGRRTAA